MYRSTALICIVFFCSLQTIQGVPVSDSDKPADYSADDYYNADDEYLDEQEKVVHKNPKFISKGTTQMINEGDTIKLPCMADTLEGFVLIWKKGSTILAVGKQLMVKDDPRVKLEESATGNTLVISLAEPTDAGDYLCQVSAQHKPIELRHSVKVRVAPEIRAIPEEGILVVKEGEPANLACEILKGSPTPEITWKRKERKLPSGEEEIKGLSVTFPKSSRHHSGHYVCTADNGFGIPTTAHITLDVQHAPTVEQEQTFIHTRENDETEVVCTVHASPKAEVAWFKNGQPLTKDQGIFSQRGNRHTLLLTGSKVSTFGIYTCRATNKFGSDERTTEVSGQSGPVNIKSSPDGEEKNRYALEWVAQSITPITAFKLQYKRIADNYIHTSDVLDNEADWIEVRVAPLNNGDHFYSGKFIIENLDPASHYLARISSSNSYGYGPFSPPFRFGTKGAVLRMPENLRTSLAPVQQPSTGSGADSVHCLVLLLVSSTTLLTFSLL